MTAATTVSDPQSSDGSKHGLTEEKNYALKRFEGRFNQLSLLVNEMFGELPCQKS